MSVRLFTKVFLTLLIFQQISFSQTRDEQILKGIDYVYRIKFDSANALFQSFIDQNQKDPTGYFFQAMTEWWKIYLNKEDRSNDDNYLVKVDKCIKVCEERIDENENDDWATFLLGGVIGYRGFMNVMRDNWLKAIDDGREGLNLVQKSYEMNPSNIDATLGLGIYNYAVDYVVQRYPILKAVLFFFPKGNKELGLTQLKNCAENGRFSKPEANAVLAFIHLSYEKNYIEAEKYALKLNAMYLENPVFERFLGRCHVGLYRWQMGDSLYRKMLVKADSNITGYNNNYIRREANYYLGLCLSRVNNFDEALKYYEQTINICRQMEKPQEESPYHVFAVLGIGIIHDQRWNRSEAIKYYDMVLNMRDVDNSRETAQKFKTEGFK
ncbi:MAG: tetratricopeptide repeat protein [Chlorobi bacterium]|nr:tetratricopeptide repeat protein [Chlorobiota bacterium]MCI0716319.1 tetratricopeptide repeat protein [Chlorobiota bacterium]